MKDILGEGGLVMFLFDCCTNFLAPLLVLNS